MQSIPGGGRDLSADTPPPTRRARFAARVDLPTRGRLNKDNIITV